MVTTKCNTPTGIIIEVEGKQLHFVDYSDYAALEQRVKELEDENARLKEANDIMYAGMIRQYVHSGGNDLR